MSLDQQVVHLKHREGSEEGTRYVAVASGKGGVGKTVFSVNMGRCFAESGGRVLIIDADLGLSNVHLMLGLTPKKNLTHFFFGEATFEEIVVKVSDNLHFISSGSGVVELTRLPRDQVLSLVRRLQELAEGSYDLVIFDTPPGIHEDTLAVVSAADIPLILTTPEPTAVADAYALIKVVNRECGVESFHLVVNKVEGEKEGRKVYESVRLLTDKFTTAKVEFLGTIRYRKNLIRKIIDQDPFEKGFTADVYNILSNMNLGVKPKRRSFWDALIGRLLRR